MTATTNHDGGLVRLVTYRWALPILAELVSTNGSKLVTLCHRLGATRPSVRRSLESLIDQGLVEPNPGYGHPMRPEYILTAIGQAIGAASERLVGAACSLDVEAVAFQKWSLPVVHSLSTGTSRFGAIQKSLPSVTSRALSLALKDLGEAAVLDRTVAADYPPTSSYMLTRTGNRLAPFVNGVVTACLRTR